MSYPACLVLKSAKVSTVPLGLGTSLSQLSMLLKFTTGPITTIDGALTPEFFESRIQEPNEVSRTNWLGREAFETIAIGSSCCLPAANREFTMESRCFIAI